MASTLSQEKPTPQSILAQFTHEQLRVALHHGLLSEKLADYAT